MTMLPNREPVPQPAPLGPAPVEIRRYASVASYQVDAATMAAAGWLPLSQVEATGGFPVAAGILAAIGLFVAVLLSLLVGAAIVVIAILIGMASRKKELVVTYRPTVLEQSSRP